MTVLPSLDGIYARNNTRVTIVINGQRVGRVQQFNTDQANNLQVLAELGRDYNVEVKKGVTGITFSMARFAVRNDLFDTIKSGQVFQLSVEDLATAASETGGGGAEIIEFYPVCAIQSMSRSFTIGQATIGVNASGIALGKGLDQPAAL